MSRNANRVRKLLRVTLERCKSHTLPVWANVAVRPAHLPRNMQRHIHPYTGTGPPASQNRISVSILQQSLQVCARRWFCWEKGGRRVVACSFDLQDGRSWIAHVQYITSKAYVQERRPHSAAVHARWAWRQEQHVAAAGVVQRAGGAGQVLGAHHGGLRAPDGEQPLQLHPLDCAEHPSHS